MSEASIHYWSHTFSYQVNDMDPNISAESIKEYKETRLPKIPEGTYLSSLERWGSITRIR